MNKHIDEGATLVFEDPAEHFGSAAISNILIRCWDINDLPYRVFTVRKHNPLPLLNKMLS